MDTKNDSTPKRRFPGFEGEWEQKRLTTIASMHARIGWQNLRTSEFLNDGDYYLITGTDFLDGRINFDNCYYVDKERYQQDKNIQVKPGSILITKDGTIGKVAIVSHLDKPATLNAGVFNVVVKESNVDEKYLYQYLASPFLMDYVSKRVTGGTIKHLNQGILVDFPVNIPVYEEQKAIGKFFEYLDQSISLHQHKLDKLKNLKKAYLAELFPAEGERVPKRRFPGFEGEWEQKKLGNLGSVEMCRRIFKEETSAEFEIPFFKIGTFGGEADTYITREKFEEYKTKFAYPQKGDLLLSASGSIGRVVEYDGDEAYYQDSNIVWLNHHGKINNKFLKAFYEIVSWSGIEGTTIKRLYNKNILETDISLPSLPEQTAIGSFFQKLDKSISLQQQKLDKLNDLKKAYLNELFV